MQVLLGEYHDGAGAAALEVAEAVRVATGGNPWLIRQAVAGDTAPGSSQVVQIARQPRLASLPAETGDLLVWLAVAGGAVTVELVGGLTGRSAKAVLAAAQPAVTEQLAELHRPATLRLVHDLVRDAVLDGLPLAERADRHLRYASVPCGARHAQSRLRFSRSWEMTGERAADVGNRRTRAAVGGVLTE